jgi:hypothetical protein
MTTLGVIPALSCGPLASGGVSHNYMYTESYAKSNESFAAGLVAGRRQAAVAGGWLGLLLLPNCLLGAAQKERRHRCRRHRRVPPLPEGTPSTLT